LFTVMSPAPVALSRSQMPLPAWPVMSPVAVSEMSPVPFWVTTMPLAAPSSVPVGVSAMSAGLAIVPPVAVKSSASPLAVVMLAAPVMLKVPPVEDWPVMVPLKFWPATLSSWSVSVPPAKVTV
jgi:hypothetical protein